MTRVGRTSSTDTAAAILDSAERLVQQRGFNGFSYADVAAELGITKASLHYHFASKAELGEALINRYCARFDAALAEIDTRPVSAAAKLKAYCTIYQTVLAEHRLCLCGMLAAEYDTLPAPMRHAVVMFFDRNQAWLSDLFRSGRRDQSLGYTGSSGQAARSTIAALEGAMLVSRPYGTSDVLDAVTGRLLTDYARPRRARPALAGAQPG